MLSRRHFLVTLLAALPAWIGLGYCPVHPDNQEVIIKEGWLLRKEDL